MRLCFVPEEEICWACKSRWETCIFLRSIFYENHNVLVRWHDHFRITTCGYPGSDENTWGFLLWNIVCRQPELELQVGCVPDKSAVPKQEFNSVGFHSTQDEVHTQAYIVFWNGWTYRFKYTFLWNMVSAVDHICWMLTNFVVNKSQKACLFRTPSGQVTRGDKLISSELAVGCVLQWFEISWARSTKLEVNSKGANVFPLHSSWLQTHRREQGWLLDRVLDSLLECARGGVGTGWRFR